MIVRNHICKGGTQVLEYIPQTDADYQQIAKWMQDGVIPAEASQADPDRTKLAQTFDDQENETLDDKPAAI